jgi:hypothetical protein
MLLNHIYSATLVIENCHRILRFSRINFTSLTTTFKTHPRTSGKETASPAKRLLWHLAGAFLDEGWKKDNVIKEENVRWTFGQLGRYIHSVLSPRERHTLWVLLLLYYLPWRLHLLQSCPLAVQAYWRPISDVSSGCMSDCGPTWAPVL